MALSGGSPSPQVEVTTNRRSCAASSSGVIRFNSRSVTTKPWDSADFASFLANPDAEPDWEPYPTHRPRGGAAGDGNPEVGVPNGMDPNRSKSDAARNPLSHARCSRLKGAVSGTMFIGGSRTPAQKFTCAWT